MNQPGTSKLGWVGRLQFVAANHSRLHYTMYFANPAKHLAIQPSETAVVGTPKLPKSSAPASLSAPPMIPSLAIAPLIASSPSAALPPSSRTATTPGQPFVERKACVENDPTILRDIELLGFESPELIATTNTSFIYKATKRGFAGSLCVKVLRPRMLQSRFGQKFFNDLSQSAIELDHGNFPAGYQFGFTESGAPYSVSQFAAGPLLQELIRDHIDIEPIGLFTQLCDALSYLHGCGLLHGKLSSSKIICAPLSPGNFNVKIIDAAVTTALMWQLPFQLKSLRPSVSPEERFGQDPDYSSDIYSLGHIMFEVITGAPPTFDQNFQLESSNERQLPPPLKPLVMRCLAKEPCDRYSSITDLQDEIRSVHT